MDAPFHFEGPAEVIGHRGYAARAPENTLVSLDAAIEVGADAVEFDIHTAGDGNPVLFHDAMLSRTTNGVGPIRRRTLEQLRGLDAGKWFDPEYAGEKIPALRGTLLHIGNRIPRIYAEVKGFRELEDVDRMVRFARESRALERTVFIAMNWTLLDRMRSQEADLKVGFIVEDAERADEAIERATGDERALIDFDARILLADPDLAQRARSAGIPLAAWTVNDPADATRLLEMGVPRITTDEVEVMVAWKRAL